MVTCPYCGYINPPASRFCGQCRHEILPPDPMPIPAPPPAQQGNVGVSIFIMLCIVACCLILWAWSRQQPQTKEQFDKPGLQGIPDAAQSYMSNQGRLQFGMSTSQVRSILGEPSHKQESRSATSSADFWYYGKYQLVFENDRLIRYHTY
jgi:hypothetical protein